MKEAKTMDDDVMFVVLGVPILQPYLQYFPVFDLALSATIADLVQEQSLSSGLHYLVIFAVQHLALAYAE